MKLRSPETTSLVKPLFVSLVLHACLITGVVLSYKPHSTSAESTSVEETIQSINIILLERNSQESLKTEVESVEVIEESVEGLVENIDTISKSNVEILALATEESSSDQTIILEQSAPLNQSNVNKASGESSGLQSSGVANAISSYMSAYTQRLNQDWLNDCIKYKNRHGTKDCPQGISDKDIRPVYRDYDQNQNMKYMGRIEFLNSAMGDNALSDDERNALNKIKQDYLFIVNPGETWTPQMAEDKFNPNLGGPTLTLFESASASSGITGLFGQDNRIINFNIVDEPEKAQEDDAGNNFYLNTPVFPLR